MSIRKFAILLFFELGVLARSHKPQYVIRPAIDAECPTGVHIVGIRGTLEKPGFGALQEVANHLKEKIPGSNEYAVEYPASGITIGDDGTPKYDFFEYSASVAQGYGSLKTHLEDYYDECPDTRIVVLGYSQGAHVLGDVLCGSYGYIFPRKDPIEPYYKINIEAIIQLGDPTNVKDIPWHVGNSTRNGVFPRSGFGRCGDEAEKWQSYCDADDTFCDAGNSVEVHLGYVARYRDDIVNFIVGKVQTARTKVWNYRLKNDDL